MPIFVSFLFFLLDSLIYLFFFSLPSSTGTPQRNPSYPKRHASFESPREIPLPSPSLSVSPSPGIASSSLLSNISSQVTPSANTSSGYFPTIPSQTKPDSSSSSSSPSSNPSSRASSQNSRTSSSGHYPVFEGEELQGHDYDRGHSDLSDWTSQTSPSPPLVMCDIKQHPNQQPAPSVPSSEPKHRSLLPFQTTNANSVSGSSTVTQLEQASNTLEGSHTHATTKDPGPGTRATAAPIFPFSRPYSLPDGHSQSSESYNTTRKTDRTDNVPDSNQSGVGPPTMKAPPAPTWPDRSSSTSLPLPSQIPFHILPTMERAKAGGAGFPDPSDGVETSGYASDIGDPEDADPSRPEFRHQHIHRQNNYPYKHNKSHSSIKSSPGSNNLHSGENDVETVPPPAVSGSSPGQGAAASGDTLAGQCIQSQVPPSAQQCSHTQPPSQLPSQSPSQTHPQRLPPAPQRQRSPSPFRAPQPRPEAASQPSNTASATYSAMTMTSYPAPEPPVILGPTNDIPNRAYEPFLSHAPPPADSWIEVETTAGEYRLTVRLPGFRRDGITLATKRRRILHVVADSWENGGGEFVFLEWFPCSLFFFYVVEG